MMTASGRTAIPRREGARLPSHRVRQLDPGRSDCASFGVGFRAAMKRQEAGA
jgi:hypothetical protein